MGRVGLCVYVIDAHTQSKSASHMSNFWEDADYVTVNIVLLLFTYCLKKLFIHYYIQKNKNKKILEVVCRLYITSLLIPHPQLCRVLAHLCPNAAVPNVQNSIHYSSISVLIDSDIKWINSTISQKSHSSPASLQKFQDSELLKTNNNKKKPLSHSWKCPYLSKHVGFTWPVSLIWLGLLFHSLVRWNKTLFGSRGRGALGNGWQQRRRITHWWIFTNSVAHTKMMKTYQEGDISSGGRRVCVSYQQPAPRRVKSS